MSDPFSSWFVTLLRSQSTKRIGRLLDAERDQRVLAALAEDALRRAISVQQPHAPSEWLTETERALPGALAISWKPSYRRVIGWQLVGAIGTGSPSYVCRTGPDAVRR